MSTVRAHVGDRLLLARHEQAYRVGVVLAVSHADGSPPYRVRWLDDGRETLVFPGEGARIEPGQSSVRRSAGASVVGAGTTRTGR